jgi:hypothetical protein
MPLSGEQDHALALPKDDGPGGLLSWRCELGRDYNPVSDGSIVGFV